MKKLFALTATAVMGATSILLAPSVSQAQNDQDVQRFGRSSLFKSAPCDVELPDGFVDGENVRCGFVPVGFTWAFSNGSVRFQPIEVAVLVADAEEPAELPPVFYLAGGPAQGSLSVAAQILGTGEGVDALGGNRDLVFIDQRGAGQSTPSLNCDEVDVIDFNLGGSDFEEADAAAIEQCRSRLKDSGINLRHFNQFDHLTDYFIVGLALGYSNAALYGVGYGADLALQLSDRFSSFVEAAILQSVDGPTANFILDSGVNYQTSLDKLYADCAADTSCSSEYGDVEATVDSLLATVTANPVTVDVTNPISGAPETIVIGPERLSEGLYSLIGSTSLIPFIPSAVTEADNGSYIGLATLISALDDSVRSVTLSEGAFLSTICAREGSVGSPEEARDRATGTDPIVQSFLTRGFLQIYERCDTWNVRRERGFRQPVEHDVPTLLIAGRYDPVAPPRYAETVAEGLANAQLLVIDRAARGSLAGVDPCGGAVLTGFLADPTQVFDDPCIDQPVTFFVR